MKKQLLTALLACSLSIGVVACGGTGLKSNDTNKAAEDAANTLPSDEYNETTSEDFNNESFADESKSFDGLIDFLVSKDYITKEGDGGSFAESLGAINGYRYYNLDTLETTEIYEFSSEKELEDISLNGMKVTPNKVIGNYAIFSENEELIKAIEEYLE